MSRRNDPRRKRVPAWHRVFASMEKAIKTHARIAFRHLDPEARAEMVQNVLANTCAALAGLAKRGKLDLAYPSVLARYGVAQTKDFRKTGGHLNINDVSSPYCQQRKGISMERLDHFDEEENAWTEAVVVDTRPAPVPDIVAEFCR